MDSREPTDQLATKPCRPPSAPRRHRPKMYVAPLSNGHTRTNTPCTPSTHCGACNRAAPFVTCTQRSIPVSHQSAISQSVVGQPPSSRVFSHPPQPPTARSPAAHDHHLASPRLTSPHLASPLLTSPRLASPRRLAAQEVGPYCTQRDPSHCAPVEVSQSCSLGVRCKAHHASHGRLLVRSFRTDPTPACPWPPERLYS